MTDKAMRFVLLADGDAHSDHVTVEDAEGMAAQLRGMALYQVRNEGTGQIVASWTRAELIAKYGPEDEPPIGWIDWHTASCAEVPHVAVYRHEGGGDETRIADVYIHDGDVGAAEKTAIALVNLLNGGRL